MRALLMMAVLVTPACVADGMGGGTTPDVIDPSVAPIPATELCGRIAQIVCEADARCCTSAPAACAADQATDCEAALQPLVDDPRLGYDPLRAGALVRSLEAGAASCWSAPLGYDALVDTFAGTGPERADCTPMDLSPASLRTSALSCAGDLHCRLYLRSDGSTEGVCEPAADDACSHAFDCGAGEFCALPSAWQPGIWGTCRPLRGDGWECASDLECESRHCDGTCGAVPERLRCLQLSYDDEILEDEPLLYLRLGAGVTDRSGHHLVAERTGSTTDVPEGAIAGDGDGAIGFDGTAGAIRVPAMDALDEASALSLECWFQPAAGAAVGPILELGSDGAAIGPHLWSFDQADKLMINFLNQAGASHVLMSAPGAVAAGTWHHAVATYDGTTGRLYLDGTLIGEAPVAGPLLVNGDLYVGHRSSTTYGDATFTGAIDEVAIYDHALTPARIAAHVSLARDPENRFPLFRWLSP